MLCLQLRDKIREKELNIAWKYPDIRLFTVDHHISDDPADDIAVMQRWSIPKKGILNAFYIIMLISDHACCDWSTHQFF